jgi:hypothetical protein
MREASGMAEPLSLDLADFDVVGVLTDAVVGLRTHVMLNERETSAAISAPDGWHRLVINAKTGGSSVLIVRYNDLTASRLRNVAAALESRGWHLDEDREGATLRQPPGTTATDVAFEALAALTLGGAPSDVRAMTALDADGNDVDLLP